MTEFQKTPGWLDWYAGPAKPTFKLPAGSVDAHCHVFGPAAEFPFAPLVVGGCVLGESFRIFVVDR